MTVIPSQQGGDHGVFYQNLLFNQTVSIPRMTKQHIQSSPEGFDKLILNHSADERKLECYSCYCMLLYKNKIVQFQTSYISHVQFAVQSWQTAFVHSQPDQVLQFWAELCKITKSTSRKVISHQFLCISSFFMSSNQSIVQVSDGECFALKMFKYA